MGVRSSVGRRPSVWKWRRIRGDGAGDTAKLDNWPLTPSYPINNTINDTNPRSDLDFSEKNSSPKFYFFYKRAPYTGYVHTVIVNVVAMRSPTPRSEPKLLESCDILPSPSRFVRYLMPPIYFTMSFAHFSYLWQFIFY